MITLATMKTYARDCIPGLECENVKSIDGPYLAFCEDGLPKWKIVPIEKKEGYYALFHANQYGEFAWHYQEVIGRLNEVVFQVAMHEAYERRLLKPHDKKYRFWDFSKMVKLLKGQLREA